MVLLRDEDIEVREVHDTPVFLDSEGYRCPLCGAGRQPGELRVATVELRGRGEPFDVLLCLECIDRQRTEAANLDAVST